MRKVKRILVIAIVTGGAIAAVFAWASLYRQDMASFIYRPPTRDEVASDIPEALLPDAPFTGIWSDRDEGGRVFEYRGSGPTLRTKLLAQLRDAGWIVEQLGEPTLLWRPYSNRFSSRVRVQTFSDRLLVCVHPVAASRPPQVAGSTRPTDNPNFVRYVAPAWRAAVEAARKASNTTAEEDR